MKITLSNADISLPELENNEESELDSAYAPRMLSFKKTVLVGSFCLSLYGQPNMNIFTPVDKYANASEFHEYEKNSINIDTTRALSSNFERLPVSMFEDAKVEMEENAFISNSVILLSKFYKENEQPFSY